MKPFFSAKNFESHKKVIESFFSINNFKVVRKSQSPFFSIKNFRSCKAVMELFLSFRSFKSCKEVTELFFSDHAFLSFIWCINFLEQYFLSVPTEFLWLYISFFDCISLTIHFNLHEERCRPHFSNKWFSMHNAWSSRPEFSMIHCSEHFRKYRQKSP